MKNCEKWYCFKEEKKNYNVYFLQWNMGTKLNVLKCMLLVIQTNVDCFVGPS